MKLLLDTHTFIWWANEPEKLSQAALTACQDGRNLLILSVVSVWEMQIKMQLGKLKISRSIRGDCHTATNERFASFTSGIGSRTQPEPSPLAP